MNAPVALLFAGCRPIAALLCLAICGVAQTPAPPHQARSVHLRYAGPSSTIFYNEVTVEESVPGSYFMVCGFKHGYYGIQELPGGRKNRVLFSVWDPGKQNDQDSVPADQRVEAVYHADDVHVQRFGQEGTGGQSFFDFEWKLGQTYKFMVEATVEGNKTSFAAWFFLNDTRVWKHLVTFRTLTGGAPLSGFYSFIEDFRRDGKSLQERRLALFGPGWARGTDGAWVSLTEAQFTADGTPVENIDAGSRNGRFYLATGGATEKHAELRSTIHRPPGSIQPPQLSPKFP